MNLSVETQDSVTVLKLDGRFDAYEAPQISAWVDNNITPSQCQIIADLSSVSFIDSTALATLVKGMKRCRQHGGDLYICGMVKTVRIIFELTRLDKAFRIFETRGEAVNAF
jgi:anti-sigma B factor antagonist